MKKLGKAEVEELSNNESVYVGSGSYYDFDCGIVIKFDKESIKNTLLYDDTDKAPDAKDINVFIEYNMENKIFNDTSEIDEAISSYEHNLVPVLPPFFVRKHESSPICHVVVERNYLDFTPYSDRHDLPLYVRDLTREELLEYKSALQEEKAAFEKRLRTYFKKYGYKIHAHGYWFNR